MGRGRSLFKRDALVTHEAGARGMDVEIADEPIAAGALVTATGDQYFSRSNFRR
jgi:hypothetical protein